MKKEKMKMKGIGKISTMMKEIRKKIMKKIGKISKKIWKKTR